MLEDAKEISRQEFLKFIPRYVSQKVVRFEMEHCLAWDGGNCQFCYLACPLRDKAITMDDQKPVVNILYCDGCARCVTACLTVNDRPAMKMVHKNVTQMFL